MSAEILVNVHGKISRPEDARISPLDRGFLFGDGVYETGRSESRCCLYMEEHLERLHRSSARLGLKLPWKDEEVVSQIHATLKQFDKPEAYWRVLVTRGEVESVGIAPFETAGEKITIFVQNMPKDIETKRQTGISLLTSEIQRNSARAQDPDIKTCNYLNSVLALRDVKARGAEDAVLLDAKGNLTEGTTFAVFGVRRDGTLITPSLEVGILNSITRRHVLEFAKQSGIKTEEGFFPVDEFRGCPEVFIASSIREAVPVVAWDGKRFELGPVTRRIQEGLNGVARAYISSHKKY